MVDKEDDVVLTDDDKAFFNQIKLKNDQQEPDALKNEDTEADNLVNAFINDPKFKETARIASEAAKLKGEAEGTTDFGTMGNFARGVAQAPTLGFSDEGMARMKAAGDLWEEYKQRGNVTKNRDFEQLTPDAYDQYKNEYKEILKGSHPLYQKRVFEEREALKTTMGHIGGFVGGAATLPLTLGKLGVIAAAKAAKAPLSKIFQTTKEIGQSLSPVVTKEPILKNIATSVGSGAVVGGAYGPGMSDSQNIRGILEDTAKSAGAGALFGGALHPMASAVQRSRTKFGQLPLSQDVNVAYKAGLAGRDLPAEGTRRGLLDEMLSETDSILSLQRRLKKQYGDKQRSIANTVFKDKRNDPEIDQILQEGIDDLTKLRLSISQEEAFRLRGEAKSTLDRMKNGPIIGTKDGVTIRDKPDDLAYIFTDGRNELYELGHMPTEAGSSSQVQHVLNGVWKRLTDTAGSRSPEFRKYQKRVSSLIKSLEQSTGMSGHVFKTNPTRIEADTQASGLSRLLVDSVRPSIDQRVSQRAISDALSDASLPKPAQQILGAYERTAREKGPLSDVVERLGSQPMFVRPTSKEIPRLVMGGAHKIVVETANELGLSMSKMKNSDIVNLLSRAARATGTRNVANKLEKLALDVMNSPNKQEAIIFSAMQNPEVRDSLYNVFSPDGDEETEQLNNE